VAGLLGWLLAFGCAGQTEPSSTLAPSIGHSQPLPTASASSEPSMAEPTPSEPTPSEPIPDPAVREPAANQAPSDASSEQPTVPPPAVPTEVEDTLCRHITAVVLSESNSAEPTGDQVDELIASCSVALAQDRRRLGDAEFRRRADCVRRASSVTGFSACRGAGNSSESH